MNKFKVLVSFLVLAVISGCGTTKYAVKEVQGESCTVYVFRDEFKLMWSMDVGSLEEPYAQLSDNTYTHFKMPAGEQTVLVSWAPLSGGIDLKAPFNCKAGKTYYLVFKGSHSGNTRRIRGNFISADAADNRMQSHKLAGSD